MKGNKFYVNLNLAVSESLYVFLVYLILSPITEDESEWYKHLRN